MPVLAYPDFVAALPPKGALMGLDPGTKTIGVALSDLTRLIASPLDQIGRARFSADSARIFALYDTRDGAGVVIGHPLNLDGSSGPAAQAARAFARNLADARPEIPMLLWDERLSTAAVTRTLLEADTSRAARKSVVDKLAAAYMLQGLLDCIKEEEARAQR
jgi:putative Holliday junction resolvase